MRVVVPWQEALYVRMMSGVVYVLASLLALASGALNWPYVSAGLILLMLALFVPSISLHLNWSRDMYPKLLLWYFLFMAQAILTYAWHFSRGGLRGADGTISHSFRDGLYFSVTTWTTLGYGDLVAQPPLRLLTSVEALTGTFAVAILVALAWLLVQESLVPHSQAYADRQRYKFTPDGGLDGMTEEGLSALRGTKGKDG
jgi:hypothetical protein